jgi:hypothetical protein
MNTGSLRPSGTATATGFVALVLPIPWLIARSRLRGEGRIAFREPLQFIVITVTVVTMPMSMRFLRDGPLMGSLCTVTPSVTEKNPSL